MRQRQNLVGARDAFRRAGLTQASAQGSNASGFHTDPGAEAHQQPAAVGAVGRRATAGAGTAVSAPRPTFGVGDAVDAKFSNGFPYSARVDQVISRASSKVRKRAF